MSTFKPFKALRPIPDKAKAIASLPYDVMDSDEARIEVQKKSFKLSPCRKTGS